jgi:hypothetical protein
MPAPVRRAPSKRSARKARVSPEDARKQAYELLDADPSLTGRALAAEFSLKARWGQLRKQEWQALRDGGEGLRVVGEN